MESISFEMHLYQRFSSDLLGRNQLLQRNHPPNLQKVSNNLQETQSDVWTRKHTDNRYIMFIQVFHFLEKDRQMDWQTLSCHNSSHELSLPKKIKWTFDFTHCIQFSYFVLRSSDKVRRTFCCCIVFSLSIKLHSQHILCYLSLDPYQM